MATTYDAKTGQAIPGNNQVDMSTLGGLAPKPTSNDPYSIFNNALTSMLTEATNQNTQNTKLFEGAKNQLTNLSVNQGNPQPFNPQASSASQVGAQQTLQNSFNPAITSITSQEAATAAAMEGIKGTIGQLQSVYQPVAIGQNLMTRDGTILQHIPTWSAPMLRKDLANPIFDQYDTSAPQGYPLWKSDTVAQGDTTNPQHVIGQNNNPYGIKSSPAVTDFLQKNGISTTTGSAALDGGNFLQFANANDSEKATRLLLQKNYGNDTVDQALRHWSNYTGTGEYPGYNGNILAGTGVDPNAYIRDLNGAQMDVITKKMLQAEQGKQAGPASKVQPAGTALTADPQGNTFSPEYQKRIATLPAFYQKYVVAGPGGVAYQDTDKGKALGFDDAQAMLATKPGGVPVGDAGTGSQLDNLNQIAQKLATMRQLVEDRNNKVKGEAPSTSPIVSGYEHLMNVFGTAKNNLFQDNQSITALNNFSDSVTTAVNNIKGVTQSGGPSVRITGFEVGDVKKTFPQPEDSYAQATTKLRLLDWNVAQMLHSAFPSYDEGTIDNPHKVEPKSQTATATTGGGGGGPPNDPANIR